MFTRQDVPLEFRTDRLGTGPLIWGQLAIWDVIQWLPPKDTSLNSLSRWDVPAGLSLDGLLAALRTLIERHDSLHTLYFEGPDGPCQQVVGAGEVIVQVHEIDCGPVDEAAAEIGENVRRIPFDSAVDLPLRPIVLTRSAEPIVVLLAVSHMALDGWSFTIVGDDLVKLMRGETLGAPAQQPLARARYEATDLARSREKKALAYWAGHIEGIPSCMIARVSVDRAPDFMWSWLESPALSLAARSLGLRGGVEPGVVLMGATALLLSVYTGEQEAALRTIVSTRFHPASRHLVGAFNQNALFRIGPADETFTEFIVRAGNAALRCYRHSEYNPRKLESMIAEIAQRRGVVPDGYCFFNDTRFAASRPVDAANPAAADAVAAGITQTLAETRITVPSVPNMPKGANFFLFLHDLGEKAVIALCVENGFLASRGPSDFLRDLERLVIRGALAQTSVSQLCAEFR